MRVVGHRLDGSRRDRRSGCLGTGRQGCPAVPDGRDSVQKRLKWRYRYGRVRLRRTDPLQGIDRFEQYVYGLAGQDDLVPLGSSTQTTHSQNAIRRRKNMTLPVSDPRQPLRCL